MLENIHRTDNNDPDSGESNFYKLKSQRIAKELESVKNDLEEKHLDEMNLVRKQFEKKVSEDKV
jgi:hypothetical protein